MKTRILIFAILFGIFLSACNSKEKENKDVELYEAVKETEVVDPLKRGEYLVNTIGCHDCHTPKKMTPEGMSLDFERLLSGHPANEGLPDYDNKTAQSYLLFTMGLTAARGPWGTSFAANLTPDATGIGTWSEDQFLKSIKEGKYKGLDNSRPLLPPMPWEGLSKLSDSDLKAIFAYLKTMKPIENIVPSAIIAAAP